MDLFQGTVRHNMPIEDDKPRDSSLYAMAIMLSTKTPYVLPLVAMQSH